jgi:L-asparagine oxygenase
MRVAVERDGYALLSNLRPQMATEEVACSLGRIVRIPDLLPSSGIPTVQLIRPREKSEVGDNQYSGHYGLNAFPLHTDLAHWILPPRYLLLRCLVGTDDVFTNLLDSAHVVRAVGVASLQKAVFRIRRHRIGSSGLVRAVSLHNGEQLFRWDPIFLLPLNHHAQVLNRAMLDPAREDAMTRIRLQHPGDTLLIDTVLPP